MEIDIFSKVFGSLFIGANASRESNPKKKRYSNQEAAQAIKNTAVTVGSDHASDGAAPAAAAAAAAASSLASEAGWRARILMWYRGGLVAAEVSW